MNAMDRAVIMLIEVFPPLETDVKSDYFNQELRRCADSFAMRPETLKRRYVYNQVRANIRNELNIFFETAGQSAVNTREKHKAFEQRITQMVHARLPGSFDDDAHECLCEELIEEFLVTRFPLPKE
jgi:hypothetical protein